MSNEFKAKNGLITPKAILQPASGSAALNISNSAPSAPVSGDIWVEPTGIYSKNSNISIVGSRGNTPGVLSQPVITITGGGATFSASSVNAVLFSASGWQGDIKTYVIPAVTGLALTDNSANYLVVTYNGGSPTYTVTTDATTINNSNVVGASLLWRSGANVHYQPIDWGLSTASRLNRRLVQTNRYQWASGLGLGESTGNVITVGSGVVWYGVTQYNETSQTSAASNAELWYHNAGVWTSTLVSAYDNLQYDDGTNLQTLANNSYGVNWIYRYIDGSGLPKIAYILGNASYTLANAQTSTVPNPPPILATMAILVGRIIVQKSAATATSIDSAFTQVFTGSTVTNHNSLNGLQGGITNEYYHLSNAQYVIATRAASATLSGYLSTTDWNTFNNKAPATSGTSILSGNGSGGFTNVTIGSGLSFVGGTLTSTAGTGTVTSVGLSLPSIFTVSGSPVTVSGTLSATLSSQLANTFFAAPNGLAGSPTFRSIVAADIPTLNQNTTGSAGSVANALTIGTGLTGTSYNGSSAVTIAIDSTVATLTGAQTLTGKTISGASNTLTNIGNGSLTNSSISINGSAISLGGSISGLAVTAGTLAQFAATTSLQLASVLSDETGTGNVVFNTSPTFNTSILTSGTSFDLLNTNATAINFGGAATTLSIGASTGTTTLNNNVVVSGNLTVNGTTTTIHSTVVSVADINITLGDTASPTDASANGGGWTLKGTTDKTINWVLGTTSWTSSENFDIATGKVYKIGGTTVLSNNTLGSAITASSLTSVGTITSGTWSGSFGAVSGANLTNLTAGNLTGTIPSAVLGNSTIYVGTTAIALNRASANLALTGILSETYVGATSGTIQVIPTAIAGTGTIITLPATTGTVITTGDTGTVSNTMLAGSIPNSKLANSTISGVALGSNLNALTIGTGLSGTSYNGSAGITIAIDSTVATLTGIQTLTNKTISGANNTLSNIGNSSLTNSSVTFNGQTVSLGGSGTITANTTNTLTIGTGLSGTSFNGSSAVTIAIDATVATLAGVQTLTNKTLTAPIIGASGATFNGSTSGSLVLQATAIAGTGNILTIPAITGTLITSADSGTVTNAMLAGSIANSKLVNSSITIGTTTISLGGSATTIAGLVSVSSTSFTGALTGNATTASTLQTARTINGVSFDGSANIVVTANTTNALTIGTGLSGTSFNGGSAVTIAIDSTVATLTGIQTLTNKTLTLPTIGGTGATFNGSTSGTTTLLATAIAGTTTLTLPAATDTLVGKSTTDTLINKTISGASNTLANIGNSSLTNSSITIGGTAVSLGGSLGLKTVGGVALVGTGDIGIIGVTYLGTGTPSASNFLRGDGTWAVPTATLSNAVTFNSSGTGAASGTTFNGSTPVTISYNTVGSDPAGTALAMAIALG